MSEPYVGEIRMFAGNFAPRSWALCNGQLLDISQNDALFSLLGTIYGGDGRRTFGLPEMRGRIPLHAGTGPGLTPRRLGAKSGQERVTLATSELPDHTHNLSASPVAGDSISPVEKVLAVVDKGGTGRKFYASTKSGATLNSSALTKTGGSQYHTNLMPTLCVNFIIALSGIYPSRS